MYSKILVPLDGSKTAENVLPFVRCFARSLQIPVELMAVVDLAGMARGVSAAEGLFLDTLIDDEIRRYGNYLKGVAKNFPVGGVQCTVGKGKAAEVIIESAAAEKKYSDRRGDPRTFRSQSLVTWQRGGKSSTRCVKSIAIGESDGENPAVGNGCIEASHRSARWVRVVGTYFALR